LALTSRGHETHLEGLVGEIWPIDNAFISSLPVHSGDIYALQAVRPTNALYAVFTSGSTGEPKGVVIEHRNFCSAMKANQTWLCIETSSRVLQFTSYSFDASLEEIFTVLVAGGCICTPSEHERLSDLAGFIRRARVNWAAFTPSFLRSLEPADVLSLAFITVHAEPMSQALVAKWAGRLHMRPSYGPTECSVTSTVGQQMDPLSNAANIGWPVGCVGWIVDALDRLVPVGAVGELLLEGPILGRGYLHDVKKTAAAFPTLEFFGARRRVYRTGDLVRHAEDGSLVFLGRKDTQQVKMRGQRVELGEIQHHLDLSSVLSLSMVLVPNVGLLQGRLVVVASLMEAGVSDDAEVLQLVQLSHTWTEEQATNVANALVNVQDMLARTLPSYMVPDTWLFVGRLPVQTSFKTDRRRVQLWVEQLDATSLQAAQQSRSRKRVRGTELEETIRDIWMDVLNTPATDSDTLGFEDSFFMVGGDSISAMQVMRRCQQAGLPVTTQDVLSGATIRLIASIVEAKAKTTSERVDSPIEQEQKDPVVDRAILPIDTDIEYIVGCTPLQQDMWHAFRTLPDSPYLYTVLVELDIDTSLDSRVIAKAWQSVVDRHPILRTIFVSDRDNPKSVLQAALTKHSADLMVVSQISEDDVITASRVHAATIRSYMSQATVPPLALRLFTLPSGKIYALLAIGHMLIDHVSLEHVLHDWDTFYRAPVMSAPVAFSHYVRNQHPAQIASNTAFWVEHLRNVAPCILSTPTSLKSSAGEIPFSISNALLTAVHTFCAATGLTLSNILQVSWALVLRQVKRCSTIVFGHLASDHERETDDAIVGPLLTLLVARLELADGDHPITAALALQQTNFAVLSHKLFSLEQVEEALCVPAPGLFDSLINFRKVKWEGPKRETRFRKVWAEDPHRVCRHSVFLVPVVSVYDLLLTWWI